MAFETVYIQWPNGAKQGPAPREHVRSWVSRGLVPANALLVDEHTGEIKPLADFPELAAAVPSNFFSKLFPNNSMAIISYYLGIFSLAGIFCMLLPGLLMGSAAVVLGILGLREANFNPQAHGRKHAWAGIILGGISSLGSIGLGVAIFANAP